MIDITGTNRVVMRMVSEQIKAAYRAVNQDSCERWELVREYCRRWNEEFDRDAALKAAFQYDLQEAVVEINVAGQR